MRLLLLDTHTPQAVYTKTNTNNTIGGYVKPMIKAKSDDRESKDKHTVDKKILTRQKFFDVRGTCSNFQFHYSNLVKMALNGRFKLHSSENFVEYMKAIGVPEQLIAAGNDPNAETAIQEVNENNYVITLTGSGKSVDIKFTLGTEFEETTPHGVKVKTVISREGNRLIQKQSGAIESVITREVKADELKVTLTSGAVTSTRIYKRL